MKTKLHRYERQLALRKAGYETLKLGGNSITPQADGGYWIEDIKPDWNAKDDRQSRINGYYCDSFRYECYTPGVARMGRVLLAGYTEPWNAGFRTAPGSFAPDDMDSAKREAHRFTERMADESREADEEYQKAERIADRIDENESARKKSYATLHGWISDLRGNVLTSPLCKRIMAEINEEWEVARELTKKINTDRQKLKAYPDYP